MDGRRLMDCSNLLSGLAEDPKELKESANISSGSKKVVFLILGAEKRLITWI